MQGFRQRLDVAAAPRPVSVDAGSSSRPARDCNPKLCMFCISDNGLIKAAIRRRASKFDQSPRTAGFAPALRFSPALAPPPPLRLARRAFALRLNTVLELCTTGLFIS